MSVRIRLLLNSLQMINLSSFSRKVTMVGFGSCSIAKMIKRDIFPVNRTTAVLQFFRGWPESGLDLRLVYHNIGRKKKCLQGGSVTWRAIPYFLRFADGQWPSHEGNGRFWGLPAVGQKRSPLPLSWIRSRFCLRPDRSPF